MTWEGQEEEEKDMLIYFDVYRKQRLPTESLARDVIIQRSAVPDPRSWVEIKRRIMVRDPLKRVLSNVVVGVREEQIATWKRSAARSRASVALKGF